jgi:hypothetical protein
MKISLSLGVCLLAPCFSYAQDYRATILGQVLDPNRAAIPKSTIRVTKQDTGVSRETVSNEQGFYTISALDPGVYTVTAAAQGFSTMRRPNIVLATADKLNLDLELEVGQVATEVVVTAEQELVNTATASRGLTLDPVKMTELPLNGRQSYTLMNLVPGVRFTQRQFGSSGFSGTRAWDVNGNFTMNGGRTGTNQFLLNGAPISTNGTFNVAPNVEAIQEFKVMVNTYDAQFGRSGGGHVNTTLKAGGNELHGSVFEFWRNRILDANAFQNNAAGSRRGFRNQHQYGGIVGGAIRKNREFFFFSFEGWQERTPFPVVSSVPPSALRNGGGWSDFGIRVYDPMTSATCTAQLNCISGGVFQRQQFPNNVIPQSRISPVGRAILNLYPTQNFIGANALAQNFLRPDAVGRYRYEQPMARYDRVLNDKNRLNFVFTFQDGSEYRNSNGFFPPAQNGNMPGTVRRDQNYILNYQYIWAANKLLTVQGSFNRFEENFPDVSDTEFTFDKLGIKSIPAVSTFPSRLAPRIQIDTFNEILGNQFRNYSNRQQANLQVNMAHTISRHSLKYGFEYAMLLRANAAAGRSSGLLNFNDAWTRQYSGRRQNAFDGSSIASTLLGVVNSGFVDFNDTFFRREPYVAGFLQDDWKLSARLTLNLGLRYDVQFPLIELHNRIWGGFDMTTKSPISDPVLAQWRANAASSANYPPPPNELRGGPLFAGVNGNPRRPYDFDLSNIQPRVGLAYRLFGATVIRSGFGIFHRTATQNNITTGFSQQTPYINSLTAGQFPSAGLTGAYSLENPWPNGVVQPAGASRGILTNVGLDANFDGRQRVIPRTFQWSFGIEHQLPWNSVLEVSYIGSRTNKETRTIQLNRPSEELYELARANPTFYQARVPNPYFGVLDTRTTLGGSPDIARFDLYRPISQFTGNQMFTNPWGNTWYHGLQVRFEKRVLPGSKVGTFTTVLNYTWSKQMENFFREEFAYAFQRFDNVGYQLTDIDVRQQLTMAGVYDLPFGRGRKLLTNMPKPLEMLAGGWNYNLWVDWNSGVPTGLNTGWDFSCANFQNPNQNPFAWFNNTRSCYTQRAPFTFRQLTARHGNITDPTAVQVNMALAKKISLTERFSLELRGEAFNALNTPIRQGPNTDPNNAQFGILPVAQFNFPRNVQLGARFRF